MPHILVVEDDEMLSRMYQREFEDQGYKVTLAMDGQAGLAAAESMPDAILLDIVMPKLDGMGVLEALKADPKLKSIPVVVITNLTSSNEIAQALKLGAARYIQKSDQKPKQVEETIREVLDQNSAT